PGGDLERCRLDRLPERGVPRQGRVRRRRWRRDRRRRRRRRPVTAGTGGAPVIQVRDVTKVYGQGEAAVHALRGVSLTIDRGEHVAVMGASGSGKSTLMHIVGCLDAPTAGRYLLDGIDVGQLDDGRL